MKIYTDNIDLEMSIEEFESILEKGLIDVMITIIAALSEKVGESKNSKDSDEITSFINEMLKQDTDLDSTDLDDMFVGFCDKDNCEGCEDIEDCSGYEDPNFDDEELEYPSEDNETVNRIYNNLFMSGGKYSEK